MRGWSSETAAPSAAPTAATAAPASVLTSSLWTVANLGQFLFLGLWTVFWGPISIVVAVLGHRNLALRIPQRTWAPGLLRASGARLDVRGKDKVDWSKPCVVVVNHQSMIDICALQVGLFPARLRFITKQELMHVPLLGAYMRSVGMIGIDRGKSLQGVARLKAQAESCKQDGAAIIAFAEGTRSRDGVIKPFKRGAFLLACEAGIPIVPVSISGARDVLAADGFRVRPGVIRIDIGDPIATAGLGDDERDDLVRRTHDAVVVMNDAARAGLSLNPPG